MIPPEYILFSESIVFFGSFKRAERPLPKAGFRLEFAMRIIYSVLKFHFLMKDNFLPLC